jgi:G3E family GTPase
MLLPNPQSLPRVTLLAGPDRALRALVLEKLVIEARPHHLTVLSFDEQRRPLVTDPHLHFHWAEAKQIQITQAGQIVPFRADVFIELNAMARGKCSDHIVIELGCNDELPNVHDCLEHRYPGGIDLRNVVRLTRSILILSAAGLTPWFWTDAAAAEPEENKDKHSEGACSRAHSLTRSVECADTIVIADTAEIDPDSFAGVMRLLRALNPKASMLNPKLERLEFSSLAVDKNLTPSVNEKNPVDAAFQMQWAIADAEFARAKVRDPRPLHPGRFLTFVREGWKGLIRTRGQVRIASQPAAYRVWSQAGRVGVLGSKMVSADGRWEQDLTLVGPEEACIRAGRNLERCLLTDEEMELGPRLWRSFVDPLEEE